MRKNGATPRGTSRPSIRVHGFTLVELLVVIAIIGVLVALLLPAVQSAREAARRSQCANNLKQIGIAVLNYENTKKHLPPGSTTRTTDIQGDYMTTWSIDILPYLEEHALYDLWIQDVPIEDRRNQSIQRSRVSGYLCPTDEETNVLGRPESGPATSLLWHPGSYRANSGTSPRESPDGDYFWDNPLWARLSESGFPNASRGPMHTLCRDPQRTERKLGPTKLAHITDGTSKTRLVGEYMTRTFPMRRTFWSYAYTSYNQSSGLPESRNLLADYLRCDRLPGIPHSCKRGWGSFHAGGIIQNLFCDGAVRSIADTVDIDLWVASSTIAGAESRESL